MGNMDRKLRDLQSNCSCKGRGEEKGRERRRDDGTEKGRDGAKPIM